MQGQQQDTTLLILSVCGVAAVVAAVILMAAFLLLRIMRFSVFQLVMGIIRPLMSPPNEEPTLPPEAYISRSPLDLKAKAQELDFDAAVAKYQSTNTDIQQSVPGIIPPEPLAPTQPLPAQASPPNPAYTPTPVAQPIPPTPLDEPEPLPPKPSPLLSRRERQRQDRDDEIMGGFMDIDGDGDEDF